MKIAITAASGQLGAAIVRQLTPLIGAENVIGVARTPANAASLGVEVRKGDYNNPEDLRAAFRGVNRVLLVSGMDKPENRIGQHRNVIAAARDNGVEKIVYTSIVGDEKKGDFSPVVRSNRQTEEDIRNSGMAWVIGRNGIYLEPDLEYLDTYVAEGEIRNCAGQGRCGYTSRPELGYAYARMLTEDHHNGNTYRLQGEPITQQQLAEFINEAYGTALTYQSVSVAEYAAERTAALGEFLGPIIAGIYQSIRDGAYAGPSDFMAAAGRPHRSVPEMIRRYRERTT